AELTTSDRARRERVKSRSFLLIAGDHEKRAQPTRCNTAGAARFATGDHSPSQVPNAQYRPWLTAPSFLNANGQRPVMLAARPCRQPKARSMEPAIWKYQGAVHCSPGNAEIVLHFERHGRTIVMALLLDEAERLQVDLAAQLHVAKQQP